MRGIHDKTQYGEIDSPAEKESSKRTLFIVSAVVVLIAASVLTFLVYSFINSINSTPKACQEECGGNSICEQDCKFRSSVQNFIYTVSIFLFVLILLGVYFVMIKKING